NALVPGDLVFKGYPVSYHVGMYAGGGQVIHAPHTGAVVSFQSLMGWQYAVRL
ncbi:MAG: C40 family peptidase, partial [Actinobacteria bacterium]|nr:C40 family peptidase [Actinomycetota bacterium]